MQARITEWQKKSKELQGNVANFEHMQKETIKKDAERREQERVVSLIKQLPLRFRNKFFDDYEVTNKEQGRIKLLAERYAETFADRIKSGTSLKFMGTPGTGKTLLSLVIYQALVKKGYTAKYEASTEFLKTLLEIKFQSQSNFIRHVESLRQFQLLIIDEVTESVNKNGAITEIERQLLFRIINDRYENNLCTLVITNRDEAGLRQCLGEPIFDRLSEGGISLAFNWQSYRQQQ